MESGRSFTDFSSAWVNAPAERPLKLASAAVSSSRQAPRVSVSTTADDAAEGRLPRAAFAPPSIERRPAMEARRSRFFGRGRYLPSTSVTPSL
ncbi:MAG: hypothetical protein IPF99_25050 [Deltaproteobacteria bacterium]|nr:hypothetical protein [Deltaproteobacteria bacterium]